MGRMFVLYDGRAKSGDTDGAVEMDTADTEGEARREGSSTWSGYDAVWFEHDIVGDTLLKGRIRRDIPPGEP